MDVARPPEVAQRRKRNRIIAGVAAALLILITTVALARLKPAAPTVEAGGLWIEPVKRGTMLRNVRGTGVLVPDEIRWITALTDGFEFGQAYAWRVRSLTGRRHGGNWGPTIQARMVSIAFNRGIPENYSPTSFLINTLLPANNVNRTMDYVATIMIE